MVRCTAALQRLELRHLVPLSAVLLCACVATAATSKQSRPSKQTTFSLAHLLQIKQARDLCLRDDGAAVAWISFTPATERRRAIYEIWVADLSGKRSKVLQTEAAIADLAWRPKRGSLSFRQAARGGPQLLDVPATGGDARPLLRHGEGIGRYSWAADGLHVAFVARSPDPDRRRRRRGPRVQIDLHSGPTAGLFVARVATDKKPHGRAKRLPVRGSCSQPKFHPDGSAVVIAVAPDSSVDSFVQRRDLHIVTFGGVNPTVIDVPGRLSQVVWSPSGKALAFIAGQDDADPAPGRLYVARAPKWRPERVSREPRGHVLWAGWRDEARLVTLTARGLDTVVREVDLRGRTRGTWRHDGLSVQALAVARLKATSKAPLVTVLASSPLAPNEVFALGKKGPPKRLSDLNPWLKGVSLGKQERLRWEGADGEPVEGVMLHPKAPRSPAALVVLAHGGPAKHVSDGWVSTYAAPGQLLAAHGYYVLYPNYRGSTGRGVSYSRLPASGKDGAEFSDILAGVDALIAAKRVDSRRVAVMGVSYGGYIAAWAATRLTKRFAAAVSLMGFSDHVSKWGTTDVPSAQRATYVGHKPWLQWQRLRRWSPLTWVKQARTPLLIAHGRSDQRIPASQSVALYRYLRDVGKSPCRLALYEGEGHSLSRTSARRDFLRRALRWFETYLTGQPKDRARKPPPRTLPSISGAGR